MLFGLSLLFWLYPFIVYLLTKRGIQGCQAIVSISRRLILANGAPNSSLDLVILGRPLGSLRRLRLPLRHNISLGFTFVLLGSLWVYYWALLRGNFFFFLKNTIYLSTVFSVGVLGFLRIAITYRHPENSKTIFSQVITQMLDAMIENLLNFALCVHLQLAISHLLLPSNLSAAAEFPQSPQRQALVSPRERRAHVCHSQGKDRRGSQLQY